jgi:hypothetical protein
LQYFGIAFGVKYQRTTQALCGDGVDPSLFVAFPGKSGHDLWLWTTYMCVLELRTASCPRVYLHPEAPQVPGAYPNTPIERGTSQCTIVECEKLSWGYLLHLLTTVTKTIHLHGSVTTALR